MKEKLFKACLKIIETKGYKDFSFDLASQESGIPIESFYRYFKSSTDVMITLFQKIDQSVLKSFIKSESLTPKDQLFDILMIRFEKAMPYKKVIHRFWDDCLFSPQDAPSLLCQGYSSMSWMLDASGLDNHGLSGMLRTQALLGLYLTTLRTWLSDDSPDLGKTMAFLDKGLSHLESAANILNSFSQREFT